MRFGGLPGSAQLYVAGTCLLAVLLTAVAGLQPATLAPLELFAMLSVAAAVAHSFPVSAPGKQAYHVSLPLLTVAIMLLAPLQLVALVGFVHVAELFCARPAQRKSITVQVFNAAAYTVTALVAQATYLTLWPAHGDLSADVRQPAFLLAGLGAAIIFALLNRCLVGGAIWFGNRISPREQHLFEAEGLFRDGILLLMGVPLAYLVVMAPWAAAIAATPLWLIHRVLDLPKLRSQRRQDDLTELFTAAYLSESCTHELNRARRFGRPLSLLLLDLDGLGQLTAAYGNQAGDDAVRLIARAISCTVREYDLPARLAGGLFAVLLPETDLAQAQEVAERVRRDVATRRLQIPDSVEQTRLTISIGGTVLSSGNGTTEQFFEVARAALTQARNDGGDQIEFIANAGITRAANASMPEAPAKTSAASLETGQSVASSAVEIAGSRAAASETRTTRSGVELLRQYRRLIVVVLGIGAAALVLVGLVWSTPLLDWRLLAGLTSVAALAGLTFYFKSLTVALALAIELHGSPARLWLARYWRLWPLYIALGATGLLVAYSYYKFGVLGAIALAAAALLFRQLAGRYVDRTVESVRTLRTANEQLEHQAFHDPLTRLANRTLFSERLERAMVRSDEGSVAVLFLDLDNFKTVNDTLGHGVGDALLLAATDRLRECVRREDTIARLGGDEFTVLLEDMRDPSDAVRMAERIGEALGTPFELNGHQVHISASIGIALDTDRSHRPDDLLREADMAMYRAKSGGKARYEIFDTGQRSRAMERLELETELRNAAERGQLVQHYLPVVDLMSGSVDAVEALLRWQHPRRGLLEPPEFMALAEQTGIVLELGVWSLNQACRAAAAWQVERPGIVVQVNLSPLELQRSSLVALVDAALTAAELPAACLRLEIPESFCSIVRNAEAIVGVLDDLRDLGVRIALDDLGDGMSSLSWLSRSPIDTIKIGASAVDSPALVRASVAIGTALGMTVTAQGVDSANQANRLAALGCRRAQGHLYGEPQSAEVVASSLRARVASRAA